jgi:ubiquinol-cytochrome c reductase iron-sulfur subunit
MHTVEEDIGFREVRRRRILLAATAGLGGAGVVATLVPFVKSMGPSEAARAAGAPVQVDISRLEAGRIMTVEFRGKPVWIVHRTDEMLNELAKAEPFLVDPNSTQPQQPPYARNRTRSIKPQYFVAIGICTHLGCIPGYRMPDWPDGFYCPCHGSRFDLAGRVFKNVPAPLNLEIPQHTYLTDTRLLVGDDRPHRA